MNFMYLLNKRIQVVPISGPLAILSSNIYQNYSHSLKLVLITIAQSSYFHSPSVLLVDVWYGDLHCAVPIYTIHSVKPTHWANQLLIGIYTSWLSKGSLRAGVIDDAYHYQHQNKNEPLDRWTNEAECIGITTSCSRTGCTSAIL